MIRVLTIGIILESNSRPNFRLKAVKLVGRLANRGMLLFCGFIWIRNKEIKVDFAKYNLI